MAVRNNSGAWLDAKGDFVPPRYIQKLDKEKDKVVSKLSNKALKLSKALEDFKTEVFTEVSNYLDTAKKHYKVDLDTEEGNKTLSDFANSLRVEVSCKKQLAFDEKLEFAKKLIDECIVEWSKGANSKLIALVEQAFQTDKKGMIDRDRILGLRKLNIKDTQWQKAMDIISDSLTIVNKKSYVRFQQKIDGRWRTVYLDIAKV